MLVSAATLTRGLGAPVKRTNICRIGFRVQDINLSVRTGEVILLTGPSDCGKTTILRLINGLIPQFYPGEVTGEILIDGEDTKGKELYDTALTVGTVFQNPRTQFYNVDTTGELAFGCENRGLSEQEIYTRIDNIVACLQMDKLMDRSIFHLSDGEKQKVACASVDVSAPNIVLLDEPSANLDYESTLILRNVILQWKSEGKTIIAAEHRIAYLWDMIDRAAFLQGGQIVRELFGDEKNCIMPGDLRSMGLRTTVIETPSDIKMDSFSEGEITAIVGANGAGKTSLLNL